VDPSTWSPGGAVERVRARSASSSSRATRAEASGWPGGTAAATASSEVAKRSQLRGELRSDLGLDLVQDALGNLGALFLELLVPVDDEAGAPGSAQRGDDGSSALGVSIRAPSALVNTRLPWVP
jgi:hypothetical protein